MVEKNIEELQQIGRIALSNPWFGVGGLERVYLAISDFKEDTTIIASKNFHDKESFAFYFGRHRGYPRIHHLDISIEGDSPWVYNCMCEAIHRFIPQLDAKIHISNHWGLFQNIQLPNQCNYFYFQPGVWELERVVQDPILNKLYQQKLRDYPILANSNFIKDFLKKHFDCDARLLYPCTDTIYFKEKSIDGIQNIDEKDYDMMIFSRLNPGKEFTLALDLFEKIKKSESRSKFLMAGAIRKEEEGFLDQLHTICRKKGLESDVTFIPNPSLETLRELYWKSKLLAFLPRNEPLGLVPVEAMSAGVPVMGFNDGGIRETIIDGKTGNICKNLEDMAEKSVHLIQNPQLIAQFRTNVSSIEKKFSERAFLMNLSSILAKEN